MEDRVAGPGQVLIRVQRAGINFADINARNGRYPHRTPKPPYVPGIEVAGTVVATGEGVQDFQPGQRVIGFVEGGSYSELAVASAALTVPIPDCSLSAEQPAFLGCAFLQEEMSWPSPSPVH